MVQEVNLADGPARGVIILISSPSNKIVASATDFDQSSYGGFALGHAQEIRCKKKVAKSLVEANCSFELRDAISPSVANDILKDCLNSGWKMTIIKVGQVGHLEDD